MDFFERRRNARKYVFLRDIYNLKWENFLYPSKIDF